LLRQHALSVTDVIVTYYIRQTSIMCIYCWIVRSELKPEVVLATIIDPERCQ